MTASPDTLRALLVRLEGATGPDRKLDALVQCQLVHEGLGFYASAEDWAASALRERWNVPPYTSSLDAAVALVERTLPGWRWVIHNPRSGLSYGASLSDPSRGGIVAVAEKAVPSAPLALCTALVRALLARADSPNP